MLNEIIISFIIYFCSLTLVGLYFYKKNKNEASFALGNRSLNYWVTAISAQTSDMGSWLFIAYPAVVYTKGLFEFWTSVGLVIFMYLNWQFIAKKIRTETEKYNSLTLSSYFESKYNDKSGIIKIASAIITLFFFTFYIASGLVGIGRLFESAFGLNYSLGVILGLFVTLSYILVGGYLAVTWCNLIQGIFLLLVIMLVPIFALPHAGGIEGIKNVMLSKNMPINIWPNMATIWSFLSLTFAWGFGYFGQPHILVNFMGIKDSNETQKAKWVGIIWQILVLFAAFSIGIIGIAYFKTSLTNPEHLFVNMAKTLFSPFIAGFALCGILAATLSTINTQILVTATSLAEDFYKVVYKNVSSKRMMFITRISTIFVALFALIFSLTNSDTIYNLVLYSWSGIGSAFSPLVILSLYTKLVNKYGAIAGIISGGLIAGIWPYFATPIPPMIPGFAISFLAILLVSLVTKLYHKQKLLNF
jgi:sodium/proline symporter